MKKLLSICILTISGLITLSGCQLAKKDSTPEASTNHLVGIYCTVSPLSEDNAPIPCTYNTETDRLQPDQTDISGCYLAAIRINESEENGGSYYNMSSDVMIDINLNVSSSDENDTTSIGSSRSLSALQDQVYSPDNSTNDSISLSGTLYVDPDKAVSSEYSTETNTAHIYLNPVYQKENGDLFLISGSAAMIIEDGGSITQTFSENYTSTDAGVKTESTNTIALTIKSISDPVTSCTYYGMSDDNTVLWSDTQDTDVLADEPISLKGAAYLLIKEVSIKGIVSYDVLAHTDDDAETTDPDYHTRYMATDSFYYQPSEIHVVK